MLAGRNKIIPSDKPIGYRDGHSIRGIWFLQLIPADMIKMLNKYVAYIYPCSAVLV